MFVVIESMALQSTEQRVSFKAFTPFRSWLCAFQCESTVISIFHEATG